MKLFLQTVPSRQDQMTKHSRELDEEAPPKKLNLTDQVPAIQSCLMRTEISITTTYLNFLLVRKFIQCLSGEQYY